MAAGKIQPFDPKAFAKMRTDISQQQAMDMAKKTAMQKAMKSNPMPVKAKPKDQMQLTEKDVFGLRSRRDMANRLQNK